ncbi:hypothetical protein AGMMS50276_06220 [Synergistales bacterium]|nr:hypothetical protein AGMMS50276_06220 [Synergistales bacterium]
MTKKLRPSLKDYLKTGKVSSEPFRENAQVTPLAQAEPEIKPEVTPEATPEAIHEVKPAIKTKLALDKVFLSALSPADRDTWSSMLAAGIDVKPLFLPNIESLREDFLYSDNTRFTFYILNEKGAPLQMVFGESQIQEPFVLVAKWDETGVLSICFSF